MVLWQYALGIKNGDNGEAWIRRRPELAGGVLDPLKHIDSRGQTIGEVDWAGIEARYDILSPELSRPLERGWVAVDQAIGHVVLEQASDSGHAIWRIGFESLVKLIDEKGQTLWETQGPANASLHYVDESIIRRQARGFRVSISPTRNSQTTLLPLG